MKFDKVYVVSPKGKATGGVELAHQLVDYLRNNNQECYIVYVSRTYELDKGNFFVADQTVMPEYAKYNIIGTTDIEDSPNNMLVLPETFFDFLGIYKNIKIGCWWMSVDNRYAASNIFSCIRFSKTFKQKVITLINYLHGYIKCSNDDSWLELNKTRIVHFYQSHYAQHVIYNLGSYELHPLMDYINTEITQSKNIAKEDIVLYNPAKGLAFTKKIIACMPDVTFIPLQGLSRIELKSFLERAKVYIDFGHFPGKDRLPREAAMNGCCVITGRLGASYFYEDLPIMDEYKIDAKDCNISKIKNQIQKCLERYEDCKSDFVNYQEVIKQEKQMFFEQIKSFFLS